MNLEVWSALITAHGDLTGAIKGAFPDPKARPGQDALAVLRGRLADRLETLRDDLVDWVSTEQARKIFRPLVFLADELVLAELSARADAVDLDWKALQRDLVGVDGGGEVFFEDVRRLTSKKAAEGAEGKADVMGAYLFCLRAGFKGRYFDEPAALRDAEEGLVEVLPRAEPLVAARDGEEGPVARPRSLWVYAGMALATVLVLQAVLVGFASSL